MNKDNFDKELISLLKEKSQTDNTAYAAIFYAEKQQEINLINKRRGYYYETCKNK